MAKRAGGYNKGHENPMYGRKHSEETLNKLRGRKHSPETIRKMRQKALGQNNPLWKGDHVGITGLHRWLRDNLPQPKLCTECNKKPSYDLANITGIYNRNFDNWKYICRSCHMNSDGRLIDLHEGKRK